MAKLDRVLDRIPEEWGKWVSVNNGWVDLVCELDVRLSVIDPKYTIQQVKQKFGGLRVYYTPSTDSPYIRERMDEVIRDIATRAGVTCEVCGGYGTLRTVGGYHAVMCDADEQHILQQNEDLTTPAGDGTVDST